MPRTNQPYSDNNQLSIETLLERHAPLVKRIAHHLLARLPDSVQADDLIQAGLEGLLDAATNFEHGKGASFETYAGIRIRGAMLDEMRRGDWSPRSLHRNARTMASAYQKLQAKLGRDPTASEMSETMGVDVDEYHAMAKNTLGAKLTSFDEVLGDDQGGTRGDAIADTDVDPADLVEKDELRARLAAAISELAERDQLLLSLYYQQELNLKEIGKVLGVSESRVSQLHAQAALRLRAKLVE
jgi:RNA polymerase sigma factor for flagellar operon FliA